MCSSFSDISDSDKEKIIKASTAYSISKGTIDKMKFFGPIGEIMDEIKPVVSLKNVEVVKG